ncbi:MAG: hypothetical protein R3254_08865 [Thiomicrorhabdus sp.]|nr:hypothetical protein [Thiomicrorhabdus sp.]
MDDIKNMNAVQLLEFVLTNPEYVCDSYYFLVSEEINKRFDVLKQQEVARAEAHLKTLLLAKKLSAIYSSYVENPNNKLSTLDTPFYNYCGTVLTVGDLLNAQTIKELLTNQNEDK